MAASTKKRATYQDVLDAPPHMVAEIIGGELRLAARPAGPHARVTSALGGVLHGPFDGGRGGPGGWILLDEPELHFGGDIVVPDLAGWRRTRMPHVPDTAFFTLAPDWICETLSRSTERTDRAEKLPFYAAFGVQYVWFASARNRTVEVMRLHEGKWLLLAVHQGDQRVRAEPFEAVELDLAALWADLPPPSRAGEEAAEYSTL
jgi:Uma2 family endonuclease